MIGSTASRGELDRFHGDRQYEYIVSTLLFHSRASDFSLSLSTYVNNSSVGHKAVATMSSDARCCHLVVASVTQSTPKVPAKLEALLLIRSDNTHTQSRMSNSGEEKIYFTSDEHLNIVYTFFDALPEQLVSKFEVAHEF